MAKIVKERLEAPPITATAGANPPMATTAIATPFRKVAASFVRSL
ncbi:MAG TPA: hypothetical protein VGN97_15300 [Mesorhizobium sp.]|jgi:hypothetical protein|nr:hypothetical protein [Mesorhizobium sp.]